MSLVKIQGRFSAWRTAVFLIELVDLSCNLNVMGHPPQFKGLRVGGTNGPTDNIIECFRTLMRML